jgi:hypothetical protein
VPRQAGSCRLSQTLVLTQEHEMSQGLIIILAFLASFFQGAFGQYFFPGKQFFTVDVVFTIVLIFLVFVWYRSDNEKIGYTPSKLQKCSVIFLTLFGITYYFFKTRGLNKGFIYTASFIALAVLSDLTIRVGKYAIFYIAQS